MDSKTIISTFIAFLISFVIAFVPNVTNNRTETVKDYENAKLVYRVYLEGKSIGLINSKENLEKYIDKEQTQIKEKYNIDKVYAPNDLDIVREYTYDDNISSEEDIYHKIKDIMGSEAFTINGYRIVIGGVNEETEDGVVSGVDQTIYVLDKSVFEESVERTVKAFVEEKEYEDYINDTQDEIVDTGKIIENLYIENDIRITKERIPTAARIYTDVESLSKYFVFGTTDKQESYVVKEGDTIEDVSFANKISVEEFLIANTNFKSKDDLLYQGQVVTLGILSPQFKTVEEDYIVEEREVTYDTKYENDDTQYVGYEKVKQEGKNGLSIVTEIQKKVNGEIKSTATVSTEEVKPSVDKVIIRGTKKKASTSSWHGDIPVGIGSWVWPTNAPYKITSNYGWRWGKLHEGVDISGTGYGSPIKAANNGVVYQSGYTNINGNYIVIAHSNGYYTMYAHLATRYKNVGAVVYAGDVIGLMGESGFAFGVHLHFAIYNGIPYRGGVPMNPFKTVYR